MAASIINVVLRDVSAFSSEQLPYKLPMSKHRNDDNEFSGIELADTGRKHATGYLNQVYRKADLILMHRNVPVC